METREVVGTEISGRGDPFEQTSSTFPSCPQWIRLGRVPF